MTYLGITALLDITVCFPLCAEATDIWGSQINPGSMSLFPSTSHEPSVLQRGEGGCDLVSGPPWSAFRIECTQFHVKCPRVHVFPLQHQLFPPYCFPTTFNTHTNTHNNYTFQCLVLIVKRGKSWDECACVLSTVAVHFYTCWMVLIFFFCWFPWGSKYQALGLSVPLSPHT